MLIDNDVVPGKVVSVAVVRWAGPSKVFENPGAELGAAWEEVDCWSKLVVNPDELAELVGIGGTMEGEGFVSIVKGSKPSSETMLDDGGISSLVIGLLGSLITT